jgi:hypothetical protein
MVSAVSCIALSLVISSVAYSTDPSSGAQAGAAPRSNRKPAASNAGKPEAGSDAAIERRASRLHKDAIVIDTHNDITSPMVDEGFDLGSAGDDPQAKTKTHTDLRRMRAGGLDAEFFAVYVGREFVNKKPA